MTQIRQALAALLDEVDRATCRHEITHRGGTIWTICDGCGRKWSDDRGGFVPYADSPAVAMARAALAASEATEVTPTMVEAGAAVLCDAGYAAMVSEPDEPSWAKRVYLAMEEAKAAPDAPRLLPEREDTLLRDYGE